MCLFVFLFLVYVDVYISMVVCTFSLLCMVVVVIYVGLDYVHI